MKIKQTPDETVTCSAPCDMKNTLPCHSTYTYIIYISLKGQLNQLCPAHMAFGPKVKMQRMFSHVTVGTASVKLSTIAVITLS